jgi:hypothetical protein
VSIPASTIVPFVFPVAVGTDQVTARHFGSAVWEQPGLLTIAANLSKCSPVPTVAVVGEIEMLMPEMIVTVAVAVFVVSACAVAVIVAVGVIVVVPLVVTVGTVKGAVYTPFESMVPQAGAITPVGQVTVHVAVWSVDPLTNGVKV